MHQAYFRFHSHSFYLKIYIYKIGILRYLGGRFNETTSALDEHQRTALHYAATIKDNGHFYNLLVHLGSNPKAIDKVIFCVRLSLSLSLFGGEICGFVQVATKRA